MTEHPGLHELINRLKRELEDLDRADPRKSEELGVLIETIEDRLGAHLEEDHQHELLDELNEEVVNFESEHPEFAGTIRSLINMLSNLGL